MKKKSSSKKKVSNGIKRIVSSSKTWEDIHIDRLEDGKKIRFTDRIPNTSLMKGDVVTVNTYAVFNRDQTVSMTFIDRPARCYDIPYRTFVVL